MKSLIRTIRTDKICKIYNGRKVVNNVSISVSQGEIVGFWDRTEPEKRHPFI